MNFLGSNKVIPDVQELLKAEFKVDVLRANRNFAHIADNDAQFLNQIFDIVLHNKIEDLHITPNASFGGLTVNPYMILSVYMHRMGYLLNNSTSLTFDKNMLGEVTFDSDISKKIATVKEMQLSSGPLSGVPYVASDKNDPFCFFTALDNANAILVGYLGKKEKSKDCAKSLSVFVANCWVAFAIEESYDEVNAHLSAQEYDLFALTVTHKMEEWNIAMKATITTRFFEDLEKINTVLNSWDTGIIRGNIIIVLGFRDYSWNCLLKRLGEHLSLQKFKIKYYVHNKFTEVKDVDIMVSSEEDWKKNVGTQGISVDAHLDIGKIQDWSFILSAPCCVNYDIDNNFHITMMSMPYGQSKSNFAIYRHQTADEELIKFGKRMKYDFIPKIYNLSGPHI